MGCSYSISTIQRNLTGSISECSMRQNNNILPIPELDSVDGALNALCISQGSSLIASIRTRLHLIDLVELYKQKRMQYQRDSHQAFTDPETIARITSERFPLLARDAPEFRQFGKSIVYFLPTRGEFEISNTTHLTPLPVSNECQNATLTIFWKCCVESVGASLESVSNKRTEF
ncbi:hypothetical protein BJX66DRAFT_327057 [Aspergillus keveii]|uniref:Uncharacterized protein n=1 Tax=Aspergillus keveii TaxID=714993 RepID=A0ABR4FYY9_9EURO